MAMVTHDDIVRIVPGIQDHTIVEILDTKATLGDLEAALMLLQNADEGLIDIRQRHGDRINLLLDVLGSAEIRPQENNDR